MASDGLPAHPSAQLSAAVRLFVDDVAEALTDATRGVAGASPEHVADDVVVEALNLVSAVIDADGLHSDDELWALVAAFGPHLPTQLLRATPADVRTAGLVAGRARWLREPSALLDILLAADGRDGSSRAARYYRRAMDLAHVVAALDSHSSRRELEAIDAYRGALLDRIRGAGGQAVPGATPPATGPGEGGPGGPTGATGADHEAGGDAAEQPPAEALEDLLAELDALVGLTEVKREVHLVADLLRVQQLRRERGLPVVSGSRHLVFTGNPGTGKTTVARLLARIYRTLGVVERGHLVETDRSGLVAGYVGQTAPLVRARFDEADGGVLFIDEAHALARGGEADFGREAVDAMVKLMEDRRDRVVLVVAGYPAEMQHLLDANPGLRSRFPTTIHFPDYRTDELLAIWDLLEGQRRYHAEPAAHERLRALLDAAPRGPGFGNGRLVRNLFEAAVARHAGRVADLAAPSDHELTTLTVDDLPDGSAAGGAPGAAAG